MAYPTYYILKGKQPFAVDAMTWARWFEYNISQRRVALTVITPKCNVSTVFLGMNYNFGDGYPILFETMVFGGPMDQETERYETWAQAERGHAEMVARVTKAVDQVAALADDAGAK
jgi:hypothetical protein